MYQFWWKYLNFDGGISVLVELYQFWWSYINTGRQEVYQNCGTVSILVGVYRFWWRYVNFGGGISILVEVHTFAQTFPIF